METGIYGFLNQIYDGKTLPKAKELYSKIEFPQVSYKEFKELRAIFLRLKEQYKISYTPVTHKEFGEYLKNGYSKA